MSQDPLVQLYGANVLEKAADIIEELKKGSNIPFDNNYVSTGISFMKFKAINILAGNEKKVSLKSLVTESFGMAAIAKYNV